MIDLRKPLEGVPGLLLMAALIFFGATIGIAVAIIVKWIDLSDALANFLGGVVGAGLGAALAVMGAVYVQRRDARDRLAAPINELLTKAENLLLHLNYLQQFLGKLAPNMEAGGDWGISSQLLDIVRKALEELPTALELPRGIHTKVARIKHGLPSALSVIDHYLELHSDHKATEIRHSIAESRLHRWISSADELVREVRAL